MKWNESGFRPPLYTYRLNWARRTSKHRTRNSSPGGLRLSTLLLGHGGSPQYWLSHVNGEETFIVSFKPPGPGTEPRTLAWKATNYYPRAPAQKCSIYHRHSGRVDINKLWGYFSNTPIMSTVTVYHTKKDIEGTTRGGGGGGLTPTFHSSGTDLSFHLLSHTLNDGPILSNPFINFMGWATSYLKPAQQTQNVGPM